MIRFIASVIILLALIVVPWYVVAISVLLLVIYFSRYYEALLIAAIAGVLYQQPFLPVIFSSLVLLCVEYIKSYTVFATHG
jgi:hypothetical protein